VTMLELRLLSVIHGLNIEKLSYAAMRELCPLAVP